MVDPSPISASDNPLPSTIVDSSPISAPDDPSSNLKAVLQAFEGYYSPNSRTFIECVPILRNLIKIHERDASIQPIPTFCVVEQGLFSPGSPRPSVRDLMEDLKANSFPIFSDAYGSGNLSLTLAHFWACLFDGHAGSMISEERKTLGITNVFPTPQGTGPIKYYTPTFLKGIGDILEVEGGFYDRTSVITCGGYLTDPHVDFYEQPYRTKLLF
jgi:hypothetical protein